MGTFDGNADEFRRGVGYGKTAVFDLSHPEARHFPARLGYESEPAWPSRIDLRFADAIPGRYRLVLDLLPWPDEAIIEVFLDGEFIGAYTRGHGQADHWEFECSITDSGDHTLTLATQKGAGHILNTLVVERVGSLAVAHRIEEPIGHLATAEERLVHTLSSGIHREIRRWWIQNDSPWINVEIEREPVSAKVGAIATCIGPTPYREMVNGGTGEALTRAHENRLPPWLILRDPDGRLPSFAVVIHNPGLATRYRWAPAGELRFESVEGPTGVDRQRLSFVVLDGLYGESDMPELARQLEPMIPQALEVDGSDQVVIHNDSKLSLVRVVRLSPPNGGPYLVGEENCDRSKRWWTVRGGQTSSTGQADYLKVYLQANGHSMVQCGGYIHGVVRPGWGCQYLLAIGDCPTRDDCTVSVLQTSSFIFAPRVEFAQPFNSVFLDGRRWEFAPVVHVDSDARDACDAVRRLADQGASGLRLYVDCLIWCSYRACREAPHSAATFSIDDIAMSMILYKR